MPSQPFQPFPTRVWQATDRTGGPLDELLDTLRQQHPGLWVERLDKTQPGDDNNVYFLGLGQTRDIVQVDTGPDGQAPFTVEADDRVDTTEPGEALAAIRARLNPAQ
ncbi:hypothetical protein FHX75_12676 [Micromonospora palomenae]|uniref:Uncharacterized protein n=1 Tax=Micromonospora palomenae TaxID=1461247 RepID=A0A561WE68_9ACTN|nr:MULTISPECIES: hypothetical protein [Micromonospora]MBQ0894921.1 hypothetical protein [Micromonospora sp. U56]TWG22156.1 hypothetical protein FHX75_12676 [Micromonospora palomenae]